MKKKKIGIVATMLIMLFNLNATYAEIDGLLSVLEYAGDTQQDTEYGYTANDKLVITNISEKYNTIEIESPIIENAGITITSYLFNVSADYRGNRNPSAYWCIDIDSYPATKSSDKFKIELDISGLDRDKIYYIYAVPIMGVGDASNGVCTPSEAKSFIESSFSFGKESSVNGEDPCFNIEDNIYGVDNYCENRSSGRGNSNNSNSNSIVYSINNISFNCNDDGTVTAMRQSWADVDIEVSLLNNNNSFEKLGTVNSDKKSFTFTPQEKNHFSIRFEPVDGTQIINKDGHCLESTSPEVTPVNPDNPVKPPVVGPKENIIYIILGTLVLYAVYRIARRKA